MPRGEKKPNRGEEQTSGSLWGYRRGVREGLMEEGSMPQAVGATGSTGETGQREEAPGQILGPSTSLGFPPSESGAKGAEGCGQLGF